MMGGKDESSIWRQIINFKSFSKDIQEVAKTGIQVRVGNGAHTRFWYDKWTGEESLKNLFPRLFMLSTQKASFIDEMGVWENGKWRWTMRWRRNLFTWEDDLVGDLYLAVNRIILRVNTSDERVWSFDKSNIFSASNFVLQVTQRLGNGSTTTNRGCLAWKNLAPPRALIHVWFVLQGRLNTKDRLLKLGVHGVEDDLCVLCKEEPETLDHVFFTCRVSSSLWYYCCRRWNISFCMPKEPTSCFISWMGTPFCKFDKKLWISMFYVIAWSIWNIRNKITFQEFDPNWEIEKKRLIWRLRSWTKSWCPNFTLPTDPTTDDLNNIRCCPGG